MKLTRIFLLVPALVAHVPPGPFHVSALSRVSLQNIVAALMDPMALLAQRSPGSRSGILLSVKGKGEGQDKDQGKDKGAGPHERVLSTVRERPAAETAPTTLVPEALNTPPGAIVPPISIQPPISSTPAQRLASVPPLRGSLPVAFASLPGGGGFFVPPGGKTTGGATDPSETPTSPSTASDDPAPVTPAAPPSGPDTPTPLLASETGPGGIGGPPSGGGGGLPGGGGGGLPGGGGGGLPGGDGSSGGGGTIPVPEPPTWGMMIMGMFVLGFAARGRKAGTARQ